MCKIKSHIVLFDSFIVNYNNICEEIQKIPFFSLKYVFYQEIVNTKIAQLDDNLNIINTTTTNYANDNNKQYVLIKYNNNVFLNFITYFSLFKTTSELLSNIFKTYLYLLNSINILNINSIYCYNISISDIKINTLNQPIIKIPILSLNQNQEHNLNVYIMKIVEKTSDFSCKPIEIYILYYLKHLNNNGLSSSLMYIICNNYYENLTNNNILDCFSQKEKDEYYNNCVLFVSQFINKSKLEIIQQILKYYNTWDNYSISIIYLSIFHLFINNIKNDVIHNIKTLLFLNINPFPNKRQSISDTITTYTNIHLNTTPQSWNELN